QRPHLIRDRPRRCAQKRLRPGFQQYRRMWEKKLYVCSPLKLRGALVARGQWVENLRSTKSIGGMRCSSYYPPRDIPTTRTPPNLGAVLLNTAPNLNHAQQLGGFG